MKTGIFKSNFSGNKYIQSIECKKVNMQNGTKHVNIKQRKVSTYLSTSNKDQKHTPKVNKRDSSQLTSPTQTSPQKSKHGNRAT